MLWIGAQFGVFRSLDSRDKSLNMLKSCLRTLIEFQASIIDFSTCLNKNVKSLFFKTNN